VAVALVVGYLVWSAVILLGTRELVRLMSGRG
jgi:hypothetical protein